MLPLFRGQQQSWINLESSETNAALESPGRALFRGARFVVIGSGRRVGAWTRSQNEPEALRGIAKHAVGSGDCI